MKRALFIVGWMVALACLAAPPVSALGRRTHHRVPRRSGPARRVQPPRWNVRAAEWPRPEVLNAARRAYACGKAAGEFDNSLLTIIDYSRPSSQRRLWVIDMAARRILFHEFVAHGQNSGEDESFAFSNNPGSLQSSIGLFRTEDVYRGGHGESLRLVGLEPGVNDRAEERQIVIHGAWYVNAGHVARFGQLGRSWGCPAVDRAVHRRLIERIKGGSAVFAYYPDQTWIRNSRFLRCDARLARTVPN